MAGLWGCNVNVWNSINAHFKRCFVDYISVGTLNVAVPIDDWKSSFILFAQIHSWRLSEFFILTHCCNTFIEYVSGGTIRLECQIYIWTKAVTNTRCVRSIRWVKMRVKFKATQSHKFVLKTGSHAVNEQHSSDTAHQLSVWSTEEAWRLHVVRIMQHWVFLLSLNRAYKHSSV